MPAQQSKYAAFTLSISPHLPYLYLSQLYSISHFIANIISNLSVLDYKITSLKTIDSNVSKVYNREKFMQNISKELSFFSQICTDRCKGSCCDPWWGIIAYTIVKDQGFSNLNGFKAEIIKGINDRAQRIRQAYVTNEACPRHLFNLPERYNIAVRDIKINGNKLTIDILAMFAFRCLFLSKNKACAIHPALMNGAEIRPPHCGFMGSLNARPDEKGYCRIIHSALNSANNDMAIQSAIEIERGASERHYREGHQTSEKAADAIIDKLKGYCRKYAAHLLPVEKQIMPGRNEPCYCGSRKKYKKCHGK